MPPPSAHWCLKSHFLVYWDSHLTFADNEPTTRAYSQSINLYSPLKSCENSLKKRGSYLPETLCSHKLCRQATKYSLISAKKNGKSKRFPLPWYIAFSPHDIQITLFFNLDKSRQPVLVTEVNSQSWQISGRLPLLPDFYLHKIRTWHRPKKMCLSKISRWAKCTSPGVTLCCIVCWNNKE